MAVRSIFEHNDGGRAASGKFEHEGSDCTVRALACVANLDYEKAHDIMRSTGRRDGGTASMAEGLYAARSSGILSFLAVDLPTRERTFVVNDPYGFSTRYTRMVQPTLKQFMVAHPKGRYIVRCKFGRSFHHVFAIVDGIIRDTDKMSGGVEVKHAWIVELKSREAR